MVAPVKLPYCVGCGRVSHPGKCLAPRCPTPSKMRFATVDAARDYSIERAMIDLRKNRSIDATFAYRCKCGSLHRTRKALRDGRRHILLVRVRPLRLMQYAYREGLGDGLQILLGGAS